MTINDEDLNEDFQNANEGEIDNDFGEFDQEGESRSFGDLVKKNPAVKIGLVVAALLVVIGAITLFGGSSTKPPNSVVGSGNDVKEVPGTKQLSPEMTAVMDEYNQQNLETAQKTGGSVMPQPTQTPKERLPFPAEETKAEDPLLRWRQMQDERLKTQQTEQNNQKQAEDPAKSQAVQALSASMGAQMNQILGDKKFAAIKTMQVTNLQELLQAKQKALADQNGTTTGTKGSGNTAQANNQTNADVQIDPATGLPFGQVPAKVIEPAGAIEYAQLLIEANSDVQGPIVGMIVSGPFNGSRILGSFTKKEKLLVMQFNTLINKKGATIPIQAFALDPDTTLTGMATDVDNRYWERIILPAAADFVTGMGQAYADKEAQTTVVTGDVVVQSDPPINTKEQIAAGIEKASERVGTILSQEGDDTQPLIRVRAGTPMGILFMQPITDQDELVGKNNPTTARTLAQQQQQQYLFQQGNQSGNPMAILQGLQNSQQLQSNQSPYGTTGYNSNYSSGYNNYNGTSANGTNAYGTSSYGSASPYSSTSTDTSRNGSSNIFSTQQYLNRR